MKDSPPASSSDVIVWTRVAFRAMVLESNGKRSLESSVMALIRLNVFYLGDLQSTEDIVTGQVRFNSARQVSTAYASERQRLS